MFLFGEEFSISAAPGHRGALAHADHALRFRLPEGTTPLRFAVTASGSDSYQCEVGVLEGLPAPDQSQFESIFRFVRRQLENTERFNVALLVPTGIGAEIGGHAGDATPVARLLAQVCDMLITHPNVVNASDINEIPSEALYVEGSVLCRFLMGTVGLLPVRSNRVLLAIDAHQDQLFVNAAVNAVSAARATYGLQCPKVVQLDPPVLMESKYTDSGSATGEIQNFDHLYNVLKETREEYDAVAISSVIKVPPSYHQGYFDSGGEMVNPWGGVEAMLTHAISSLLNVPSAHSPMFESQEIANVDPGIVEPRLAAEAISVTFLQCILKGLQRSPKIITGQNAMLHPGVLTAADVSCLVMPDGCLGLPTLAALEQGIPVIAVRENKNLMKNDLTALPWAPGQFYVVENYWEAAGVLSAMKAGIAPDSVRRPIKSTTVEIKTAENVSAETPRKDAVPRQ